MFFVAATDLPPSDEALLGNNIRPGRRRSRFTPDERANRRIIAAVNRSLSAMRERVSRLDSPIAKPVGACRRLAS